MSKILKGYKKIINEIEGEYDFNIEDDYSKAYFKYARFYDKGFSVVEDYIFGNGNFEKYYAIPNQNELFKDTFNIGKKLYELTKNDLKKIKINTLSSTLIEKNIEQLKKKKKNIFDCLLPFLNKYGLPIYVDESNFDDERKKYYNTNNIYDLLDSFLMIYILTDVIQNKYETTYLNSFFNSDDIPSEICKIFNHINEIKYNTYFNFRYETLQPDDTIIIRYTNNLFQFCWQQLFRVLFYIENIKGYGELNIFLVSTCDNCGNIINYNKKKKENDIEYSFEEIRTKKHYCKACSSDLNKINKAKSAERKVENCKKLIEETNKLKKYISKELYNAIVNDTKDKYHISNKKINYYFDELEKQKKKLNL